MTTVFHEGELALQTESGVKERVHKFGNKMLRDHIIDQHRDFFESLPYVFIALHDEQGQPWVSLVQGEPGFIDSPDNKTLNISGSVIGTQQLSLQTDSNSSISVVGLDLSNRRRNRLNGRLNSTKGNHLLSISVVHSFGNCPKYVQSRQYEPNTTSNDNTTLTTTAAEKLVTFSNNDISLIKKTDTLFIASSDKTGGSLDVNHRGGKPGFVRVKNSNQLWFNDYPGNNFFQTFGNIHKHPNVGMMFLDFETGDLLLVCGVARLERLDGSDLNSSDSINSNSQSSNSNHINRETLKDAIIKQPDFLPRRFYFTLERGFRFKNAVTGSWSASELSPFIGDDLD